MLIFPIENKPDWKNPPLITIAIILLNLAVFLFYQSADNAKADKAVNHYLQNNLFHYEQELAFTYLQRHRPDILNHLITTRSAQDLQIQVAILAFNVPALDDVVEQYWSATEDDISQWKNLRFEFESLRDQLSSFRYGLVPAESQWYQFLTYAYLHGGWEHILGNMVFLFLFGFFLELSLGPIVYAITYSLAGIFSGALFWWLNQYSLTPLVGASGAVSGLMGAYIIFYGLKRIRFFYTIGFYFGEIKAPALAILPMWIAKELYGHYFLNDQVAYSAHLGGLLFGAAMLGASKPFIPEPLTTSAEVGPSPKENTALEAAIAKIRRYAERLDVQAGNAYSKQALNTFPTSIPLLEAYFSLAKLQVNSKHFHEATFDALQRATKTKTEIDDAKVLIKHIIKDYNIHAAQKVVTQHDGLMARVAYFLLKYASEKDGIAIISAFSQDKNLSPTWTPALNSALRYYRNTQQPIGAEKIQQLLKNCSSTNV